MSLYLDILLFILLLIAGFCLLFLFRRVSGLTRQHESLVAELTRQVESNRGLTRRITHLEKVVISLQNSPVKEGKIQKVKKEPVQQVKPEPTPPVSRESESKEQESLWHDVIFLAKQGLSADTIARDLNITRGEVELILGLHNFKPKDD